MGKGWERANQLQKRISDFKKRIIRLSSVLPRTKNGQHVSNQIFKSGTSVSANYAEARSAESEDDFIHKLEARPKGAGGNCRLAGNDRISRNDQPKTLGCHSG